MKTILYSRHIALEAKIVEFGGWRMPLHYKGVVQEHHAVRQKVGIFDISHMGRVLIKGQDAEVFLDYLSTNKIVGKPDFSATYTVWCNRDGKVIDDVIIYRENAQLFFVVVNAANREKDLKHIQNEAQHFNITIETRYSEDGILAIQGFKAPDLIKELFPEALKLKKMHFALLNFKAENIIISRTGYTGCDGFELYAPSKSILALWELFLDKGQRYGIEPVGLGARDTLRLEMGYALYGHEISDEIYPSESVAAWTIKWDKGDFLGKKALLDLENSPSNKRHEYGVIIRDRGIARENSLVYRNDKHVGKVTSGTFSPSLNQAIAIIIVNEILNVGDIVEIAIRQGRVKAEIVSLPFR